MIRRHISLHVHHAAEDPRSLSYSMDRALWTAGKPTRSANLASGHLYVATLGDTLYESACLALEQVIAEIRQQGAEHYEYRAF